LAPRHPPYALTEIINKILKFLKILYHESTIGHIIKIFHSITAQDLSLPAMEVIRSA